MQIDPAGLDKADVYRLMISCIVPRPIAWVSTVAPDGTLNAAPFSYFQALSSQPPTIMISVGRRRDGRPKDTRRNIEATGEFVVNVVGEDSGARMVMTSVGYEPDESEFEKVGLEPVPSVKVKPPRIAECAVALECRLDRVFEIGPSGIALGEIVLFHVRDDLLTDGKTVDPNKLRPLGRLGGSCYAPLREVLEITAQGEVKGDVVAAWRHLRDRTLGADLTDEERDRIRSLVDEVAKGI
jgi:flavin reductase (DIM6/NTAB) family NADH-FMN oxidoreductase RutF